MVLTAWALRQILPFSSLFQKQTSARCQRMYRNICISDPPSMRFASFHTRSATPKLSKISRDLT